MSSINEPTIAEAARFAPRRSIFHPAPARLEPGSAWFIGGISGTATATMRALAASDAADVILHDAQADETLLGSFPAGCYRERAARDPERVAERVRKLAGDGWRIVRLVEGDAATSPPVAAELQILAGCGFRVGRVSGGAVVVAALAFSGPIPRPQDSMTAFSGLAG